MFGDGERQSEEKEELCIIFRSIKDINAHFSVCFGVCLCVHVFSG